MSMDDTSSNHQGWTPPWSLGQGRIWYDEGAFLHVEDACTKSVISSEGCSCVFSTAASMCKDTFVVCM